MKGQASIMQEPPPSDAELTSPLDGILRGHGAMMVSRYGRCVAAHFGSAASETAVCLSTVGIADRADRATFELHGAPEDVDLALAALAPLCDRTWWARTTSRSAIVRCDHSQKPACSGALERAEGTSVVDVTGRYAAIGVIGPRAADLLSSADFHTPEGQPILLRDGPNSLELLVDGEIAPALWGQLLEAGAPLSIACVGLDALEHLAASHRVGRPTSPTIG
jgi:glycine cleavage system aminomethyltransferase T